MAMDYFIQIHESVEMAFEMDEKLQDEILFFTQEDETVLSKHEFLQRLETLKNGLSEKDSLLSRELLRLKNIETFNDEHELKSSALIFLQTLKTCMEKEMHEIVVLLEIEFEDYSNADDEKLNLLINTYNINMDNSLNHYYACLEQFSIKYDLEIEIPD